MVSPIAGGAIAAVAMLGGSMVGRLSGAVVVGVVGVGVEVAGVGGRRQAEGSCNEWRREGFQLVKIIKIRHLKTPKQAKDFADHNLQQNANPGLTQKMGWAVKTSPSSSPLSAVLGRSATPTLDG